jgi:hypothetical protein
VKLSTLVAVVLIVAGLAATWRPVSPSPEPIPAPADAATRAAVAPVGAKLANHKEDGRRLASFYAGLADVIARDQGKIVATTAHLRELHRRAGLLMFQQTGIAGKYPGLAEAINKVLADRVGLENVPLDAAKQKAAVEAFRAIAWACQGG